MNRYFERRKPQHRRLGRLIGHRRQATRQNENKASGKFGLDAKLASLRYRAALA